MKTRPTSEPIGSRRRASVPNAMSLAFHSTRPLELSTRTNTPSSDTITTLLLVSNLHCGSCIYTIKEALSALSPAPLSVSCNILTHEVTVVHLPELKINEILRALLELEFEIDSFRSSANPFTIDTPGNGTVVGPSNGHRRSLVNGASEVLLSALESSKKRKRHLETCEQCKKEHGKSCVASPQVRPRWSLYGNYRELPSRPESLSNIPQTVPYNGLHEKDNRKKHYSLPLPLSRELHKFQEPRMVHYETPDDLPFEKAILPSDASIDAQSNSGEAFVEVVSTSPSSQLFEALFSIEGMTCSACTGRVSETLQDLPFVRSAEVALISNSASVKFDGQIEDAQKIVDEIEDIGYGCTLESVKESGAMEEAQATDRTIAITVKGMFCDHCPTKVISALEAFSPRLHIDKPITIADPIMVITYTPAAPDFTIRQIVDSIKNAHPSFEPSIYHPPSIEERSRRMLRAEQRRFYIRLVCCVIVAIPTFLLGVVYMSLVPKDNKIGMYLSEYMWAGKVTRMQWALFFLASLVQFFIADVFHVRAFKDIRGLWRKSSRVPILRRFYRFGSMNLLVSLGVSIAYFASVALLIIDATTSPMSEGQSLTYFDSTVFLTMFLLMGRSLEMYSKSKTADAVGMLGNLRPKEALLAAQSTKQPRSSSEDLNQSDLSSVQKVPVDMLEAGDLIVIPHGGSPPVDGKIVSGESKFDESSLTGEAHLVQKHLGDTVYAGTINRGKIVHVRVDGVCGESMLDKIVKLVREGQTRRAPIERIADVITGYFVPVVTLIAILTWVIWLALGESGMLPLEWLDTHQGGWAVWSLGFAIAVFVVACPCGIGLAAPTALFVGSGLAAKHGILVKGGGEAFQEASSLDCVVFDKTGTLTEGGEPIVTDEKVFVTGLEDVKLVYAIASCLEENSSHPLAKAVVNYCQSKEKCAVISSDVEEIPGRGLSGTLRYEKEMYQSIIGNEAFMEENGVAFFNESALETLHKWKSSGKSVILLATKSSSEKFCLWAIFAVTDPIRVEARYVISSLKKDGIAVYMLSGDNPTTAIAVANSVGIPIDNVIAGVLPTGKAERIQLLQKTVPKRKRNRLVSGFSRKNSTNEHRAIVAFVGDGINDAPALVTSDVGIAIGSGSDIAINSAKFILLNSNLTSLLTLTSLSRKVFRRVKFNFFWACIYNIIALPVAAGAFFAVNDRRIRLDPVWASLAMAGSSVSVICSSLLLRSRIPGIGYRAPRFEQKEDGRKDEVEGSV